MEKDATWATKVQMIATYNQLAEDGDKGRKATGNEVMHISNMLERLEERYILEKITREIYEKTAQKFKTEKWELTQRMGATGTRVFKLENCIDSVIDFSSGLATVWIPTITRAGKSFNFWYSRRGLLQPKG